MKKNAPDEGAKPKDLGNSMQHYRRFFTKWNSTRKLRSDKFTLIFSPHIDDAFLSLYATMLSGSLGKNIICANVFSTSDSKVATNRSSDFSTIADTSITRLREELDFSDHLRKRGINYLPIFLGFKDAALDIYYEFIASRGARLLPSRAAHERAADFISSYTLSRANRTKLQHGIEAVISNFKAETGAILLPIGVGEHLDHLMVRHALSSIDESHRIGLYADIPYMFTSGFDSVEKLSRRVPMNFRQIQRSGFDARQKERVFKELYESQYYDGMGKGLSSIAKRTGEVIFWNREK